MKTQSVKMHYGPINNDLTGGGYVLPSEIAELLESFPKVSTSVRDHPVKLVPIIGEVDLNMLKDGKMPPAIRKWMEMSFEFPPKSLWKKVLKETKTTESPEEAMTTIYSLIERAHSTQEWVKEQRKVIAAQRHHMAEYLSSGKTVTEDGNKWEGSHVYEFPPMIAPPTKRSTGLYHEEARYIALKPDGTSVDMGLKQGGLNARHHNSPDSAMRDVCTRLGLPKGGSFDQTTRRIWAPAMVLKKTRDHEGRRFFLWNLPGKKSVLSVVDQSEQSALAQWNAVKKTFLIPAPLTYYKNHQWFVRMEVEANPTTTVSHFREGGVEEKHGGDEYGLTQQAVRSVRCLTVAEATYKVVSSPSVAVEDNEMGEDMTDDLEDALAMIAPQPEEESELPYMMRTALNDSGSLNDFHQQGLTENIIDIIRQGMKDQIAQTRKEAQRLMDRFVKLEANALSGHFPPYVKRQGDEFVPMSKNAKWALIQGLKKRSEGMLENLNFQIEEVRAYMAQEEEEKISNRAEFNAFGVCDDRPIQQCHFDWPENKIEKKTISRAKKKPQSKLVVASYLKQGTKGITKTGKIVQVPKVKEVAFNVRDASRRLKVALSRIERGLSPLGH